MEEDTRLRRTNRVPERRISLESWMPRGDLFEGRYNLHVSGRFSLPDATSMDQDQPKSAKA